MSVSILVVDDEQLQLQALCEALLLEDFMVTASATATEALAHLSTARFDILLTDLKMPGRSGIDLMIDALAIDSDIVTVLMTGHGSVESAVAAMRHGAFDYVQKPFRMTALRPVLARAMQVRRLRIESRDLRRRIEQKNAQLETVNRELDAFASRIAHDIAGPVQNMIGFARMLLEEPAPIDPRRVQDIVERILRAGARADGMVEDLLAFARLGDGPMHTTCVKLDVICRDVIRSLELKQSGREVQWDVHVLPEVTGDASLLTQVMYNLLSNALKFTSGSSPAIISIGSDRDEHDMHRVWVRDNGVGFDRSRRERLFAPFARLHSISEFPGHGIGLAHVKRIIARHGGTVAADSVEANGTVFSFTLPD